MRRQLAVLMVTALVGALISAPLTQTATAQSPTPGLTLSNVSGTLARGGQFSGSLTITRLSSRAGQLSADGTIIGTVTSEAVWATPVSTGTPSTNNTIFAATSTPAPTSESSTFAVTPTPSATTTPSTTSGAAGTVVATATPTHTVTIGLGATATPTIEEQLPRLALESNSTYQAGQSTSVSQSFRDIPLTLTDPDLGACDVLSFDLGQVFVDQLGVQLDLAPATLDVAALPRANRPLGGLLCTVASLLDLGPANSQAAMLADLLPLVNRSLGTVAR